MELTLLLILTGCAALAALAIGAGIFFLQRYLNPDPSPVALRLEKLKVMESEESGHLQDEIQKTLAKLYKGPEYKNEALGKFLEKYGFFQKLRKNLQQAGMTNVPPDRFFLMYFVLPIIIALLLTLVTQVVFFLAIAIVPVGFYVSVLIKKGRRLKKFTEQLPDALNLMTSSLRAGHAFQSSLKIVSTEMGDPVSTEFSDVVRDINLGIPVKDSLDRLSHKLDTLADVHMFVTAVLIQREAGGNLAEVLDKLSYTIRERFKLKGQISALTGQSRLTGYLLGAAPLLLFIGLTMIGYTLPMLEHPLGYLMLGIGAFLMMVGFVIMKKIVDIRV